MKDNLKYYLDLPGVEKQLLVNMETAVRYSACVMQKKTVNRKLQNLKYL